MYSVIKSLLSRQSLEVTKLVKRVLQDDLSELLLPHERGFFEFLKQTLAADATPSEELFLDKFPDAAVCMAEAKRFTVPDAAAHFEVVLEQRRREAASYRLRRVADQVDSEGFTEAVLERLRRVQRENRSGTVAPVPDSFALGVEESYNDRKQRPSGLLTGIPALDQAIGGMAAGTLNTIMGFTAHFKSTWALNIAYNNAFQRGYNVAYISLEMTAAELKNNFLSRHSFHPKFDQCSYIPHEWIRRAELNPAEEEYLFKVILPDFDSPDCDSPEEGKGKILVLDQSHFPSDDLEDIHAVLVETDESCIRATGRPIDAFIWDHLQMFKFSQTGAFRGMNEYAVMNAHVNQFRKWALGFRGRPTIQLLLAQTNREGWKRAMRQDGVYELTALAEVNEAERASSRVLSVYTDDKLKAAGEAKVQILKSRFGVTLADPVCVYVQPECALFGDYAEQASVGSIAELDALFGGIDW